jgi:hypothetical protein
MRILRGVASLIAAVFTGGVGVTFIVAGAGGISFASITPYLDRVPGTIFLILVGVVLILSAIRLLIASVDERTGSGVFSRESEGGQIALTSFAVGEFIRGILRDEVGLDQFRVGLERREDGVAITVKITLSHDQSVTDVGQRIQTVLAREVPARTGVGVASVSILVKGIRALGRGRATGEV